MTAVPEVGLTGRLLDRLVRLEAIEAARSFVALYPVACDAQDLTALAVLFGEHATLEVPGRLYKGRAEVIGFFEEAFRVDPTRKSHFITNLTATYLGDSRVRIGSYLLYTAAGEATSVIGWGEYEDVVVIGPDGPSIEHKSILIRRAVDVRAGWALA